MSGEKRADFESSEAQRYFRRIEDVFIELRGAPLLLSPKDWQVARGWYERGVPLGIVEEALRDLFERRRARDIDARVHSLSYCASAVDEAFRQVEELQAPGLRTSSSSSSGAGESGEGAMDVPLRLERLARAVERALPQEHQDWGERIRALAGDAEVVENALARVDEELIESLAKSLEPARREGLDADVERGMRRVAPRLEEGEREQVSRQLRSRWLHRELDLPVLSLFSSAAEAEN